MEDKLIGERTAVRLTERLNIGLFGNFGSGNFGNESTLQAILHHLRLLLPEAQLKCICTSPAETAAAHNIRTVSVSRVFITAGRPGNRAARLLRSMFIGLPNELYRWFNAFAVLRRTNALIVPGTGLLTDAYDFTSWGPYGLFRWSLVAKICGCKVFFVSVGAGPIDSRIGKWLARASLALAHFRSYRDAETREYLASIGADVANDAIYPDLAFSVADEIRPGGDCVSRGRRTVVGLGLMLYHSKLSADVRREATYHAYLEQLIIFVQWLLARDYDIRLLIGDLSDRPVIAEFKALLKERLPVYDECRILNEPILSSQDLLAQLAQTDAVVATRFHNVLLALALHKPVISISFHQKCTSLMQDMGLPQYCQDIKQLNADRLIEQFCQLKESCGSLKAMIGEHVTECRRALDEQYDLILQEILPDQQYLSLNNSKAA
jgi:polysaccharide pyruvyl transferase WcaK-like protein